MKTFLKPLTMAEEQHYLQQYQRGDMEAKTILIERNLRLVAHVVKKYQGADVELDDLISIGTIGLMKAISTFDPGKTTRLSTYAARCIDNELLMMFRTRKKHSREVSLSEPIGTDKEGNTISLIDVVENDEMDTLEQIEKAENISLVQKYVAQILNEREKEIIVWRYGLDGKKPMTQKKVGEKLGISRSYVSRIEKRALEKLKKALDNSYRM